MALRHIAGSGLLFVFFSAPAFAHRPDGLDCDRLAQVPAARCAEWKQRNADGRWWCRWDLETGSLGAMFGSRDQPISPGLDLTKVTRESSRSDNAKKTLLEAYARQLIRRNEPLFGFKPNGYELELVDFQRRPSGVRRTAQADGSMLEEVLPAVSTVHLQQIVKHRPLDGATIELQVDDENRLLSMFSSFLPDPPATIASHSITSTQALNAALTAIAAGYGLTDDDLVSTIETYSVIDGDVRPTFQVYLSIYDPLLDQPSLEKQVVIDGKTGAILDAFDTFDAHDVPGFSTARTRLFIDNPPIEDKVGSPANFAASLSNAGLHHMRIPTLQLEGARWALDTGYFAQVANLSQDNWSVVTGADPLERPTFKIVDDSFSMLIDFQDDADSYQRNCKGFAANEPFPDGIEPENALWESRLDEVSAYFNIDQAAEHFSARYGYQLSRSSRANPGISTNVNSATQFADAYFAPRTQWDGAHPVIVVHRGWCWRIVENGNDAPVLGRTADFYSLGDVSRDRDVMMHEFTHAVNWDIIDIGAKAYSKPFKEAVADFFPVSSRYQSPSPDRPAFSPWFNNTELDRTVGGIEDDLVTPYHEKTVTDEHDVGRIWSQFLWDLRDRAVLLESDVSSKGVTQHSIEDLQFEAFFRMDTKVSSFTESLRNLLAADAETNGKVLSYDIVSSAARHGIKLDRGIAAVEPNHFVVGPDIDATLNLTFTIYTGANDGFSLEVATDPALLGGEGAAGDPRYYRFVCMPPSCVMDTLPGAVDPVTGLPQDRENLRYDHRIPPDRFHFFNTTAEQLLLFYRVTSFGVDGTPISDIPGAGFSWQHPDLPAVVYVPSGAGTCVCAVVPARARRGQINSSLLVALAAIGTVVARRRIRT